jgi:alpha-1,3-rhamnosyltransferase
LRSVWEQDYKNIEIIVSDDCSTDNTLLIINELTTGGGIPILVTSTKKNCGICGNYNNGLQHAKGKWIKYIAGDDILQPDCISKFVKATEDNNDKIFISGTLPFTNSGKQLPPRLLPQSWFAGDVKSQEKLIVRKGTIIEGPTLFIERETLLSLNGFDEKYPFIEDYPIYMKFLANGYRIHLVNHHLVRYRTYAESVSHSKDNSKFTNSILDAIEDFAIPASLRNHMYLHTWHLLINKWLRHGNVKNRLFAYILRVTDLLAWKNKLQLIAR